MPTGLSAAFAGCEALCAERPADGIRSVLSRMRSVLDNDAHDLRGSREAYPVRVNELVSRCSLIRRLIDSFDYPVSFICIRHKGVNHFIY